MLLSLCFASTSPFVPLRPSLLPAFVLGTISTVRPPPPARWFSFRLHVRFHVRPHAAPPRKHRRPFHSRPCLSRMGCILRLSIAARAAFAFLVRTSTPRARTPVRLGHVPTPSGRQARRRASTATWPDAARPRRVGRRDETARPTHVLHPRPIDTLPCDFPTKSDATKRCSPTTRVRASTARRKATHVDLRILPRRSDPLLRRRAPRPTPCVPEDAHETCRGVDRACRRGRRGAHDATPARNADRRDAARPSIGAPWMLASSPATRASTADATIDVRDDVRNAVRSTHASLLPDPRLLRWLWRAPLASLPIHARLAFVSHAIDVGIAPHPKTRGRRVAQA
mmetsp:Transcript_2359/g.15765  ORF Transcript_2359/g.15765 Transcript_2359/m.15765 type:complete len:340 (+) Transcript_2359:3661-4680(+)